MSLLETRNLCKTFGGIKAVDGVSFRLEKEGLLSIIGPNGAGKTTLFNLISGVFPPSQGEIHLQGEDITNLPAYLRIRRGIGRSFQITNIFPQLTVLENVRLSCQSKGRNNWHFFSHHLSLTGHLKRSWEILQLFRLKDSASLPAYMLPHGDKRKLEMAITVARDPDILLLDEPAAGISTEELPTLTELIKQIKEEERRSILLVEHRMDVVLAISDEIMVLNRGQILARGTKEEIMENNAVQKAYLGGGTM